MADPEIVKICEVCGEPLREDDDICPSCKCVVGEWMPRKTPSAVQIGFLIITLGITCFGVYYSILLHIFSALIIVGIVGLFFTIGSISVWAGDRKLAKNDYEKYVSHQRKMREIRLKTREETKRLKEEKESERLSSTPACPICGSKSNVHRLGNLDRTMSTAVWGAASSAIGKQWECTHCNHKFNVDVAAPQSQPVKVEPKPSEPEPTVEIRKYKQLLYDGIITQEDYDQKKKQLLGL